MQIFGHKIFWPVFIGRSPGAHQLGQFALRPSRNLISSTCDGGPGMTTPTQISDSTVLRADSGKSPLISASDLPTIGQFIDGRFQPSSSSRSVDVIDPCTEEVLAQVA